MAYGDKYQETPEQKEMFRLWAAINQVENIIKLTENNAYKQFIYLHLNPIYYELKRQLTNLEMTGIITKQTQKEK